MMMFTLRYLAICYFFICFWIVVVSVRLSLRHRPVLRDRLFTAVLAGAFAHGFYLVYPFRTLLNFCDNIVGYLISITSRIQMNLLLLMTL